MRAVGLEPTRRCHRGILSPLRLPVPPRPRPLFLRAFFDLVNGSFEQSLLFCKTGDEAVAMLEPGRGQRKRPAPSRLRAGVGV